MCWWDPALWQPALASFCGQLALPQDIEEGEKSKLQNLPNWIQLPEKCWHLLISIFSYGYHGPLSLTKLHKTHPLSYLLSGYTAPVQKGEGHAWLLNKWMSSDFGKMFTVPCPELVSVALIFWNACISQVSDTVSLFFNPFLSDQWYKLWNDAYNRKPGR